MKIKTLYTNFTGRLIKAVLATVLFTGSAITSMAQLNPLQAIYYQNPYLYNPALAGMENLLNLNLNYRQQWGVFPGSPKTGSFTLDFQPADKVGLGLNIEDDEAGLIKQTNMLGTYAYHLPLSDDGKKLNFGLSAGINSSKVNGDAVIGDQTDIEIVKYNQLKPYVDGALGMAYTSNSLSVGGAIPDIRSMFFKSSDVRFDADRLVFITVASYKFLLENDGRNFVLEPLAAFRVVNGYNDIFDAGVNFAIKNAGVSFQVVYHTSNSLNLGFGLDTGPFVLNVGYNVETGALTDYTNGAFELGIKLRFRGRQK